MKKVNENISSLEEVEDTSVLEDVLGNTIFPIVSGAIKTIAVFSSLSMEEPFLKGYLGTYIILGAASDIVEGIYQALIQESSQHCYEYKPFSCLEKHIFYDLPKYAINKLRHNKK